MYFSAPLLQHDLVVRRAENVLPRGVHLAALAAAGRQRQHQQRGQKNRKKSLHEELEGRIAAKVPYHEKNALRAEVSRFRDTLSAMLEGRKGGAHYDHDLYHLHHVRCGGSVQGHPEGHRVYRPVADR